MSSPGVKRWSLDCKATVKIGEFSRGGLTRGDHRASDHDMGCQEKYVPCGMVDEASGALHITFGSSWTCSHDTGHIWEEILPHPSELMSRTLKDLERQTFAVFWGMIRLSH